MTSDQLLKRLQAPSPTRRRRGFATGDAEVCPVSPRHGAMLQLRSGRRYCPDQSHDMTSPALHAAPSPEPISRSVR